MSDPLISVLIPNYNYARFLPETLDSVLRQSYQHFEIILSDDASDDDSDAVCRSYAAAHPCIHYHRQPRNLGMVPNWNWCLQQARGSLIKPLMADDILSHPEALERMARILTEQPDIALVTCARNVINENGHVRTCWQPLGKTDHRIPARLWRHQHLENHFPSVLNSIGEPTAVMFRMAQAARGFDPQLRQLVDLEMWIHLLSFGDLYVFGEPLCSFRQHPSQQTAHNKTLYRHRQEEREIYCRYSPSPFLERHLYRITRQMTQAGEPQAHDAYQQLRNQFSPWTWFCLHCHYRKERFYANFYHSWIKRTGQGAVE